MDSNERKRLEKTQAWFEAIIESSNDAIISKTLDGIITSWNPGAERLFGYTAAEIVGQPMTRLFPPNRMDEELKIIERLKNEERVEHFETVRVAKDGKQLQILATFSKLYNVNQDPGAPGIAVGRYPEDIYGGANFNGVKI